jgi:hypothetical protein
MHYNTPRAVKMHSSIQHVEHFTLAFDYFFSFDKIIEFLMEIAFQMFYKSPRFKELK